MSKVKVPIHQFLFQSRILIDNSISDPGISSKLATFGYPEAKISSFKTLLIECDNLQSIQLKKYGDQMAATSELNALFDEADKTYKNTLKVARIAFHGTAKPTKEISLYGPRMRNFPGWVEQVKLFYANLLGDEDLLTGMAVFGYTPQKLQQESALMEQVYQKHLQQMKSMGEAQEATKIRNQKLDELTVNVSNLRAIAKIALSDNPQQLEKLGILARSGRPAHRKKQLPESDHINE